MKSRNFNPRVLFVFIHIALVLVLSGCFSGFFQTMYGEVQYNEFVIVQPTQSDNMSSLAGKYFGNPKMDWVISDFNDIEEVIPGQELIIPLRPFEWGGLRSNGYQLVPILAYQGFSNKRRSSSSEFLVAKADFIKQMDFLKDSGFRVITLDQFFDFLDFRRQIPDKSVVITIDGGWKSSYDIAYPILKKYDYPATLFLCCDFIGKGKNLSWDQIKEMSENGIDIECGMKNDFNLVTYGSKLSLKAYLDDLEEKLKEPKSTILIKTGKKCKYLAYPQGETNDLIIALLKKTGYEAAFTTSGNANPSFTDNYRIGRAVILGNYDLAEFKKNLKTFQVKELQ